MYRTALTAALLWPVVFAGGCKILESRSPQLVAEQLSIRTGSSIAIDPPHVVRHESMLRSEQTEDSAVAHALANNAAFREALSDLGIAHSDVIEAGIIPNPDLRIYAPVSPRPLESYFEFPIDAFILRPKRVAIAKLEEERIRNTVVQTGLNLVRDVRLAYADALLSVERQRIARDNETLRHRIAGLSENRLKAGDASPVDVATARADAKRSSQEFQRAAEDVPIALEKLRILLGSTDNRQPLHLMEPPLPKLLEGDEPLIVFALETRPDALAARQAIASAQAKAKLAKHDWFRFFGNYYTFSDLHVVEHRPGFRMTVPIFNWNEGKIARADADLAKAEAQSLTVHDKIVLDVRQAFLQCQQAKRDLERWQTKIRPTVEDAIAKAERAYQGGDAPLLLVLETSRLLLETRLREAQLRCDYRKAFAELERSVGRKLEVMALPTLRVKMP